MLDKTYKIKQRYILMLTLKIFYFLKSLQYKNTNKIAVKFKLFVKIYMDPHHVTNHS